MIPEIPWREMLSQIHGIGLQWKAIGKTLDCNEGTVRDYVGGRTALLITFERGLFILHLHKTLCPIAFKHLAPDIKEYIRTMRGYEAVKQIMDSH